MDERIGKQLAFALEIDKEKNIFRQTHLSGHGRNENDAEHAWHMAIDGTDSGSLLDSILSTLLKKNSVMSE